MSTLTVPLNGSLIALPTLLLRPTPTGACARPYPASLPRDRHAWRTFVLEAGSSQELPEIRHSVLPEALDALVQPPGTDAAEGRARRHAHSRHSECPALDRLMGPRSIR